MQWLRESSSSGMWTSFDDERPTRSPAWGTSIRLPDMSPDMITRHGLLDITLSSLATVPLHSQKSFHRLGDYRAQENDKHRRENAQH